MRKIPTVFVRDPNTHIVTSKVDELALWVLRGEGYPTEKLDGTNVRLTVRSGEILRVEKRRNPTRAQKEVGILHPWYVDASADDPAGQWICAAVMNTHVHDWPDGEHPCEAVGPKISGNPYGRDSHICWPFYLKPPVYTRPLPLTYKGFNPLTYKGLKEAFRHLPSVMMPNAQAEGIIWHHPDGRAAKLKRKDFGY